MAQESRSHKASYRYLCWLQIYWVQTSSTLESSQEKVAMSESAQLDPWVLLRIPLLPHTRDFLSHTHSLTPHYSPCEIHTCSCLLPIQERDTRSLRITEFKHFLCWHRKCSATSEMHLIWTVGSFPHKQRKVPRIKPLLTVVKRWWFSNTQCKPLINRVFFWACMGGTEGGQIIPCYGSINAGYVVSSCRIGSAI